MPCLNYLQSIISLGEHNPWPASWLLHITYFLSFQEAINIQQEDTLKAASRGLPIKGEDMCGKVIPGEGRIKAWLV